MVSREKVLERKLSRIESLLNATEIAIIVQIPVTYIVALFRKFSLSIILGLVVLYASLISIYLILRLHYRRIFEEWSRDPPMKRSKKLKLNIEPEDIPIIIAPIATIAIILILWLT